MCHRQSELHCPLPLCLFSPCHCLLRQHVSCRALPLAQLLGLSLTSDLVPAASSRHDILRQEVKSMPASIRAHSLQGVAAWVVSSMARSCQAKQKKASAQLQQVNDPSSKQSDAASQPLLPEKASSHSAPKVAGQKRSVADMEGDAQPEPSGSLESWQLLLLLLSSRELADAPAPDLMMAAATRACKAIAASNALGAVEAAGREAVLLRQVLLTLHTRFGARFSPTLEQRWAMC